MPSVDCFTPVEDSLRNPHQKEERGCWLDFHDHRGIADLCCRWERGGGSGGRVSATPSPAAANTDNGGDGITLVHSGRGSFASAPRINGQTGGSGIVVVRYDSFSGQQILSGGDSVTQVTTGCISSQAQELPRLILSRPVWTRPSVGMLWVTVPAARFIGITSLDF